MPSPAVFVSGTVQDLGGNGNAAQIVFTLVNTGGLIPYISGTMQTAIFQYSVTAASNGVWSANIYGLDQLTDGLNMLYQVQCFPLNDGVVSNSPSWTALYNLTSGTYDLSTQPPIGVPPGTPIIPYITNGIAAQTAPNGDFLTGINSLGVFSYALPAAVVPITYSATPTFSGSGMPIVTFVITLTGNVTSSTLSGVSTGALVIFKIIQDGTGGHTFVWPANTQGGMVIDTDASSVNMEMFMFDGTNLLAVSAGVSL